MLEEGGIKKQVKNWSDACKQMCKHVQACAKIYHNTFLELQLAVGKIPLIRPQRNDHTQTDL